MEEKITLDEIFTKDQIESDFDVPVMEELFSLISKSLILINRQLEVVHNKEEIYSASTLAHISTYLLIKINIFLEKTPELGLSYRGISDAVYNNVISEILNRLPAEYHQLFLDILRRFLFDACSLFNYDFNELTESIDLKYFYTIPVEDNSKVPKYVWVGSDDSFYALLEMIDKYEICEKNEFKKLFDDKIQNKLCSMNRVKADTILQFMVCLKESGLVRVSGIRGFYRVLETRVLDFNQSFLKNRSAQRRVDVVKNLVTWEANQEKYNQALKSLILICH